MSSLRPTLLESIRDDSLFELEEAARSVNARDPRERSGEAHTVAALCHRRLAICALLADADPDRFFTHLCHSAHARLDLLQRIATGQSVDGLYGCASKELAFIDALAAGHLNAAVAIARLASRRVDPSVEYEDDFCLHHFLHQHTLNQLDGQAANLPAILGRWRSVVDGGLDPYLDVCQALLDRNGDAFNGALCEVIDARVRSFRESPRDGGPNDELRRTEGALFMNGLALLRLAELHGIETRREYPTVPSLARVPLNKTPPMASSWMFAD